MLKKMFLNVEEHRLRSGWRLLLFLVLIPVTSRLLNLALRPLFGEALDDQLVRWLFRGVIVIIAATLVVWLSR